MISCKHVILLIQYTYYIVALSYNGRDDKSIKYSVA